MKVKKLKRLLCIDQTNTWNQRLIEGRDCALNINYISLFLYTRNTHIHTRRHHSICNSMHMHYWSKPLQVCISCNKKNYEIVIHSKLINFGAIFLKWRETFIYRVSYKESLEKLHIMWQVKHDKQYLSSDSQLKRCFVGCILMLENLIITFRIELLG